MENKFSKLRFNREALTELHLPDIEYPIPTSKISNVIENEGKIYPEALIYWIMDYISSGPDDREIYEISLLKIAELFSDDLNKSDYTYESQLLVDDQDDVEKIFFSKWSIRIGVIDVSKPIVTVQNKSTKEMVIGSFSYYKESYNLKVCLYTAPSLNVIEYIRTFGKDNLSDVRKFNSFLQLVQSTKKWSLFYTEDKNQDFLCNWEFGLGWKNEEYFDEKYFKSLNLNPIPSDWVLFFIKIVEKVENSANLRFLVGLPKL